MHAMSRGVRSSPAPRRSGSRRAVRVVQVSAALAGGCLAGAAGAAYVYDPGDFAAEVVSSANLPAAGLYNDPQAVLGRPTLRFNSGTATRPDYRRAKLIEGVFNTSPAGERLITTLNAGQSITVHMGRRVYDDPANPFGVDLNVFGNAFFSPSGGTTSDATNLNTATVSGGVFAEDVRVSVSPDNVQWYAYANGPTGDGLFPTNSYRWDRAAATWSDDEADPTRPVDPALRGRNFAGMTGADVLDLYAGSAGGAGFDLAESGFPWVEYVRVEGLTGYSGGEIDAIAAVRAAPEPGAAGLLAAGGAGAVLRQRRRRGRRCGGRRPAA